MTLHRPVAMQNAGLSAFDLRQVTDFAHGPGVGAAGDLKVTQRGAGANMSVDVAAGRGVIPGPSGSYVVTSDDVENLAIAAAPGAGNGRIDLVVARARDEQAMGVGADNDWVLEVITGTPGASPTVPATPAYATPLARVTLTDATSSITNAIITDARKVSVPPSMAVWPRVSFTALADQTATAAAATWDTAITFSGLVPNRDVLVMAWVSGAFAAAAAGSTVGQVSLRFTTGATAVNSDSLTGYAQTSLTPVPVSQFFASALSPSVGGTLSVFARIFKSSGDNANFTDGQLMAMVLPR